MMKNVNLQDSAIHGDHIVFANSAPFSVFDPIAVKSNSDVSLIGNIFETLVQISIDNQQIIAGLAEEWEFSEEKTLLTLILRDGIFFSDGNSLDGEDIIFSLNRARNSTNSEWSHFLQSIKSVDVERGKILIKLKFPDPKILFALATFNASIVSRVGDEDSIGIDPNDLKQVSDKLKGTGPFQLERVLQNGSVQLGRNRYYYGRDNCGNPIPYLDSVILVDFKDNDDGVKKLLVGEIDGLDFIPYYKFRQINGYSGIQGKIFPSTRIFWGHFNISEKIKGVANPLFDVRVRQALNYATNKEEIIVKVTDGFGTPMESCISRNTPLFNSFGPVYAFDQDEALRLLTSAGYEDGFSIDLMILAEDAEEIATVQALANMWSRLNVKINVESLDVKTRAGRYRNGDYQMRFGIWTDDISDPSELIAFGQASGWVNEDASRLFEESQNECDLARRKQLYLDIQKNYLNEAPMLYLYEAPYLVAVKRNIYGYFQTPLGAKRFAKTYISCSDSDFEAF